MALAADEVSVTGQLLAQKLANTSAKLSAMPPIIASDSDRLIFSLSMVRIRSLESFPEEQKNDL
ncbi:hypothetical protein ACVLD2_004058 [Paenibacillus sp. PvR052]